MALTLHPVVVGAEPPRTSRGLGHGEHLAAPLGCRNLPSGGPHPGWVLAAAFRLFGDTCLLH